MRVLIAGMGSQVGTGIALALDQMPKVKAIGGFDLEPPRRWVRKGDFKFAEPNDAYRVSRIVDEFQPDVVVHAWVFEPRSRSAPGEARRRTVTGTESLLAAISQVDSVRRIVVRSGTPIYGRGRDTPDAPTTDTPVRPTTNFGHMLARVEDRSREVAEQVGASFAAVRLSTTIASNLPTPLGRYLRLPVVPIPFSSNQFGVVHLDDAARVCAAAATSSITGPINVMAPGPLSVYQALRIGRRIPAFVFPAALRAGRLLAEIPGTPLPEHVLELLIRGRVVTPTDLESKLGVTIERSTSETISRLYAQGRLLDFNPTAGVEAR